MLIDLETVWLPRYSLEMNNIFAELLVHEKVKDQSIEFLRPTRGHHRFRCGML